MIIPPTDIFWLIHAEGEAAQYVASQLSEETMKDIAEAILVSDDFTNDVQAHVSLDLAIKNMKEHMPVMEESMMFNPLYIPSTPEQIDEVMTDSSPDTMQFIGMDGSPFTMKTIGLKIGDHEVITGKITCRPFELPSYNEILREQKNVRLN